MQATFTAISETRADTTFFVSERNQRPFEGIFNRAEDGEKVVENFTVSAFASSGDCLTPQKTV